MTTPTQPVRGMTDLDMVRAALVGEYDVLEELGRGGMAIVYRARERMLEREVAIKVLPFSLSFDEDLVERFLREARTAARLEHPHIVPIHRVGRVGQVTYFVMKLLRGHSLAEHLADHGCLSPAETRRVLVETAGALGYAHRHGVVHRDVKPDNILLDETGRCIVTDFGIARSTTDSKLTSTGASMGTPRYMSPEQARARAVDGRSDIYSLGCVAYQCLAGHPPFDGPDALAVLMEHVSSPVPRPALDSDDARALYAVVERMLAKAPEARYSDAEELIAVLQGQQQDRAAHAPRAARPRAAAGEATVPLYAPLDSGPRSSAALDRALEAGIEMLRQQRPRVDAGLAAGRRVVVEQAPRVRTAVGGLRDLLRRGWARVRTLVASDRRRIGQVAVGAAVLLVLLPVGAHFAFAHRSRCGGGYGETRSGTFTLLLEEASSIRRNGNLQLYYDVCGLERGTAFTTRVTVSRIGGRLRGLLGDRTEPKIATTTERASGPALRYHRTIDMDDMPSGGYYVDVLVVDGTGRRRQLGSSFRVRGGE